MTRTTAIALALGAALVGVTGNRASAQVVTAGVYVGAPHVYVGPPPVYVAPSPVYAYEPGPPPGPGYYWDARLRRWCYRRDWVAALVPTRVGPAWGERYDRYDRRYDGRFDRRYDERFDHRRDERSGRRYDGRHDTRYDGRHDRDWHR